MARTVVLAAVLLAAALAAMGAPRAAHASHGQPTIFDAPRELRADDPGVRAAAIADIRDLGATWVRVVVPWHAVAPHPGRRHRPSFAEKDPAAYNWYQYDRMVAEIRAAGLNILMTPSGPAPRWATLNGASTTKFPSATRFGRFVQALGTRYRAQVGTWSIWNEPNLSTFLGPQYRRGKPYSPKLYRRLYQKASGALKASGNGRDRVLIGETAPRYRRNKAISPLEFFRGVLCLNAHYKKRGSCKKLDADGWAHHPYTTGSGPYWVPPRRDDVSIGTLGRMTSALYKAGKARALKRGASLWLTEFGVQSAPDPYVGVSQQRQNEWRAIGEMLAYRTGRVKAFSQYLLRDDLPRKHGHGARYSGFETGLRRSSGSRKKSYNGFRLPLVADHVSRRRVSLWGLVRPADGRVRATVQRRDRHGWHTLKRVRTDGRGYFTARTTYRNRRTYRVVWDPSGRGRYVSPTTRVTSR